MENFTKRWKWSISIVAIGLITMYGCTDVVMMEELKDSQESFDRNAPINFSGCVIDPLSCRPVANATVTSGATTVTTDSDGKFQTSVEESLLSNSVSVSKDGHVPFSFIVDYNRFKGDIRIDLPRRQQCVWIGPDEGAWYKVSTYNNCLTYIIDIFTGSVKNWTEVCIGPGGNAYGAGIDIFFGLASISVAGPNGEHIEFSKRIDVRYSTEDLLGVAEKSDCLAEEYSFNPDQDGDGNG